MPDAPDPARPAAPSPRRRVRWRLTAGVLALYVVPVALTVVGLAAVDLWELAVALVVLEVLTVACVRWAVRTPPGATTAEPARPAGPVLGRPGQPRTGPKGEGLRVLAGLVAATALVVGVTLVAVALS